MHEYEVGEQWKAHMITVRGTGTVRGSLAPHMGTTFFVEGVKDFFSCVHGSKMAIGEVMFLAAIAWVKRGRKGGGKKFFHIKKNNCLLLNKNCVFSHLLIVATTQFDWKKRHAQEKRTRKGGIE